MPNPKTIKPDLEKLEQVCPEVVNDFGLMRYGFASHEVEAIARKAREAK